MDVGNKTETISVASVASTKTSSILIYDGMSNKSKVVHAARNTPRIKNLTLPPDETSPQKKERDNTYQPGLDEQNDVWKHHETSSDTNCVAGRRLLRTG